MAWDERWMGEGSVCISYSLTRRTNQVRAAFVTAGCGETAGGGDGRG